MHSNIQALDKQKHHKVAINPVINNVKKWPYFKMLWCKHREIFKERLVIFATLCMKWLTHFTSISRSFFLLKGRVHNIQNDTNTKHENGKKIRKKSSRNRSRSKQNLLNSQSCHFAYEKAAILKTR